MPVTMKSSVSNQQLERKMRTFFLTVEIFFGLLSLEPEHSWTPIHAKSFQFGYKYIKNLIHYWFALFIRCIYVTYIFFDNYMNILLQN